MIIYKATNKINGKSYIGQTKYDMQVRISGHVRKGHVFHEALKKYGREAFRWEILENCASGEELNDREKFWISFHDTISPKGYNLTDGGRQCEFSDTTKTKMSEKAKCRCLSSEYKEKFKSQMSFCKRPIIDVSGDKNPRFRKDIDVFILRNEGRKYTIAELATKYKCGKNTIRRKLNLTERKKRIDTPRQWNNSKNNNPRYRHDLDNNKIFEMSEKYSIYEIADILKAGSTTIRRRLNEIRKAREIQPQ